MSRLGIAAALVVMLLACSFAVGAGGATARASVRLVEVVDGLSSPVYVTQAPGEPGRLYVVEQDGVIRIVERGRVLPQPFLDIRSRVGAGGERGLLGLAFSPDYPASRVFVVNYTNTNGDTRVVRYRSNGRRALPGSARTLLAVAQPYSNHNGGMVVFGPDGKLYVGTGDGGSGGDPEDRAQDMGSLLGKLIRLDAGTGAREIVALGLRNPWRFSFDRATGALWIGDVGQNAIEEVDRLPGGVSDLVNFGWDVYEGNVRYEDKQPGPGRLVGPVAQYTHDEGCSITGGYVVRGAGPPGLKGRYVYGDYCSGTIWSVPASAASPRPRREGIRVADLVSFGEDLAGRVYAVSHGGTVYRIV